MRHFHTRDGDDPLKRMVEKQTEQEEFSPMDPPDAYSPPQLEAIPHEAMHPFLQKLHEEHQAFIEKLNTFEEALLQIQRNGAEGGWKGKLREFFRCFDNEIVKHSQREDKILFPLLHQRLLEKGEHSLGPVPTTAIQILEEDHREALQLAALSFNFFGLAARLPNRESQVVVLDAAVNQGKTLIEHLRLHFFREDKVVFPKAHQFVTKKEFDLMSRQMEAGRFA